MQPLPRPCLHRYHLDMQGLLLKKEHVHGPQMFPEICFREPVPGCTIHTRHDYPVAHARSYLPWFRFGYGWEESFLSQRHT